MEQDASNSTRRGYQFIHFMKIGEANKISKWSCRNNKSGDQLAEVRWYGAWRKYCFLPTCPAVYSAGCLADIQDFIRWLDG
jgi:hypothetical protein